MEAAAVFDLRPVVFETEVEFLELEGETVLGWVGFDAVGGDERAVED